MQKPTLTSPFFLSLTFIKMYVLFHNLLHRKINLFIFYNHPGHLQDLKSNLNKLHITALKLPLLVFVSRWLKQLISTKFPRRLSLCPSQFSSWFQSIVGLLVPFFNDQCSNRRWIGGSSRVTCLSYSIHLTKKKTWLNWPLLTPFL